MSLLGGHAVTHTMLACGGPKVCTSSGASLTNTMRFRRTIFKKTIKLSEVNSLTFLGSKFKFFFLENKGICLKMPVIAIHSLECGPQGSGPLDRGTLTGGGGAFVLVYNFGILRCLLFLALTCFLTPVAVSLACVSHRTKVEGVSL